MVDLPNTQTQGQVPISQGDGTNRASWGTLSQSLRVQVQNAPGATPAIDSDNWDIVQLTGLSTGITSLTTNLTGTFTTEQKLIIEFLDDGTAQSIAWGASFESTTVILPLTTVISTWLRVGLFYNLANGVWDCVAVA